MKIILRLITDESIDGVILGCTELPLILTGANMASFFEYNGNSCTPHLVLFTIRRPLISIFIKEVLRILDQTDIVFYRDVEQSFIAFAENREDIRAAFIIGSRARTDHHADQWSDMDIVLYTTKPSYYLQQQDWLDNIGAVLCSFVFQTAGGDPERLNLFQGGWQVDIVIHSVDILRNLAKTKTVPNNFFRGVRAIIDKDHLGKEIIPTQFQPPQTLSISETAYLQVTNMFWFSSLYIAKQLLRGELWVAKMREYDIKSYLLQMIEWHEKIVFGGEYDTWHAGRFICEWADEDIQVALSKSFGRYDQIDSWNALLTTVDLFQKLSEEISHKMQYPRPVALEMEVSDWIKSKTDIVK